MSDITRILNVPDPEGRSASRRGDVQATDELLPLVYEELRLLAAQKLSHEAPGQTLQATALVHEVYLRLTGEQKQGWASRAQFFRAAAEAMRRILIDNARRRKSAKRGGRRQRVGIEEAATLSREPCSPEDLIALDDALARLAHTDPDQAEVVKLRYFAGLTVEQTAEVLGISATTTKLHWAYARAWLLREIG